MTDLAAAANASATPDERPVQLFDPPPPVRALAPADVLRLLIGGALIAAGWLVARWGQSTMEGFEEDVLRAFSRLPDPIESVSLSAAQLLAGVAPVVAVVILIVKRRFRIALLLVLASTVASLLMIVADSLVFDDRFRDIFQNLVEEQSSDIGSFPNSSTIASTVAIVTVAAPWVSRRWRRALWASVGVLVVLRLLGADAPALDLVLALGVGTVVGSAILLVFGSPVAEPRPDELLDAVRRVGFDPRSIERPEQSSEARHYELIERDGARFDVTLRTPDERDAALLDRAYRRIRLRASEVRAVFSSVKRRIEHEVLLLELAARGGVRVPVVVRIGDDRPRIGVPRDAPRGSRRDLRRRPSRSPRARRPLAPGRCAAPGRPDPRTTLEGIVADRPAPRGVADVVRPGGDGGIGARPRPRHRPASGRDRARGRRASGGHRCGGCHGTDCGRALHADAPTPCAPRRVRRRTPGVDTLLDELRREVDEATGEQGLALEDLERVKPRTVLIIVASTLAFYSLLPQLANIGDTVDAFGDADYGWLVGVLVVSALTYVFAAVSFQGAVADPVPFAPNLRAQVAASFAGLVGPAGAGGFALTTRFLERVGVSRAEAGTSVGVKALAGFAMHALLLVGFIVWTGRSDLGGFSLPAASTLLIVVVIVLIVIGIVLGVGPIRRRVMRPALDATRQGISQIARVFRSPVRVFALFGGSGALSLAYVCAMACAVEAFGGGVSFPQIGAAYLFAVALATLSPTPGGLGALESGLIAGLTGFGMGAGEAVSATLTFRLATFWLPILPGWLVVGWMQRNEEL